MTYKASSYINDTHYGYRVKSLFILLSKTFGELNDAPSKVSDLRSIIYHLEKTKENIFDVQNAESEELANTISRHLDDDIRAAEHKIKEIDQAFEKILHQKDFIIRQLNEHGVPWHDRSILVGNFRKKSAFLGDGKKINNKDLAMEVYKDLCHYLQPETFKIKLLGGTTTFRGPDKPNFSAIITFPGVYADQIKECIKDIAQDKLTALSRGFGISDDKDLDDLSSEFLYDFYVPSSSGHVKSLFSCLLKSKTPEDSLKVMKFNHELVFLNLDEYYDSSDLLSEYVSMVSQNNKVIDPLLSQKAQANCMEAYYKHHQSDVNIGRLMQALEREMEASQSLKQISQ